MGPGFYMIKENVGILCGDLSGYKMILEIKHYICSK